MDGGAATNSETKTITSEVIPKVSPQAKAKVKKPKGWLIALIILGLIIIGLAGFLIYHFVATSHDEKSCEEKTCEIVEVKDEETGETVKIVKVPVGNSDDDVAVRELVDKLFDIAMDTLGTYDIKRVYNGTPVLYQPEGWKTALFLNLTYGFEVEMEGTNENWKKLETVIPAIKTELQNRGFEEYPYSTLNGPEYINRKSGIVCNVGEGSLPYELSCGSVNWYDAEKMDLINELAEAVKEKEGQYPYHVGADLSKVQNSSYEPYQKLQVSLFNAMGEFYRTSPNSPWIFFRGGQAAPDCSEYDTDDLKRAFVGDTCWNEATNQADAVKL